MHVMLALDESVYGDTIVRWIRTFPHPVGTHLMLVHVIEPLDVPKTFSAKARQALRNRQEAEGRALLSRAKRVLLKSYPDIKTVLCEGSPIYEVLRLIRGEHPDLVVSGTRGLRGASGLVLGSLSQRLLNYASCSVLLVSAKAKPARAMRVLLATDGSRGAREAARFLSLLPDLKEVTLTTTVRPIEAWELELYEPDQERARALRAQVGRGRRAAALQAIEATEAVLRPSGLPLDVRILTGHPAEVIPKLAKKDRYDLLVVGSRGLTGRTAMAMGSVSLALAQCAPCPVLVVKRG